MVRFGWPPYRSQIGAQMRIFWIVFDHYKLVIVLFGLAAPFLFVVVAVSFERPRTKPGHAPHFGFLSFGGCAVGSVLGLTLLLLGMCSPPAGKGEAAEAWFAAATPVLSALERYHTYRGKYPDSLGLLVPSYLDSARLPHNQYGFMYRADRGQYQLGFLYSGPGMNTCTLRSPEKRWSCYGFF
jgi:hypothetical protein